MTLSVNNLKVQYKNDGNPVHAVNSASFSIGESEIVGLLGESGGGKSTLSKSIVRDLDSNANIVDGEIEYDGANLLTLSEEAMQCIRWEEIAYVPQNAMNCLDPVFTIKEQLTETVAAHRDIPKEKRIKMAEEVFQTVGIDPTRLNDYPHQMSGGMKQRIVLALSLILDPKLIIADEPTTGLDVLLRDKVLADLERYKKEFGISILIVSHDIADLVETCDRLMVMYGGKIVEKAPSSDLINEPKHPYTMGLKYSLPRVEIQSQNLISMDMDPPNLKSLPSGCIFMNKCPFKQPECEVAHPEAKKIGNRMAACYFSDDNKQFDRIIQQEGWPNNLNQEVTENVE